MYILCQLPIPIEGKPSASTYCMRKRDHSGPCAIEAQMEDTQAPQTRCTCIPDESMHTEGCPLAPAAGKRAMGRPRMCR